MKSSSLQCLKKLAEEFGYTPYGGDRRVSFRDERTSININFEFTNDKRNTVFVYLYVRTTSWDLPGERTDANEFISVMLGVFLRVEDGISSSLWDIPHPAEISLSETEIYARYLVANQPFDSEYVLDDGGVENIRHILGTVRQFEFNMPWLFDWTVQDKDGVPEAEQGYGWVEIDDWAKKIASTIDEPWQEQEWPEKILQMTPSELPGPNPENIQYNWRINPNWKYYRSIASGVTVYEMPGFASAILDRISKEPPWQTLDGTRCKLYLTNTTCNAITYADSDLAHKLLDELSTDEAATAIVCIPLEHDLIAASPEHIVFIRRETGRKLFENERESIRKRHQRESTLLFPIRSFEWQEHIDDQQFELMILDLLKREPGVQRARIVSGSTEPDGGRDILCDWHTPPTPGDLMIDNVPPSVLRRVIVQCKASKKSVNKSDVQDIRDTVEHNEAEGYFLAVSLHLTTPLTDHLDRIRQRGQIWVDWWTRSEIEERLAKHQDIAQKYPGVVDGVPDGPTYGLGTAPSGLPFPG